MVGGDTGSGGGEVEGRADDAPPRPLVADPPVIPSDSALLIT